MNYGEMESMLRRKGDEGANSPLPGIVNDRIEMTLNRLPKREEMERRSKRIRIFNVAAASLLVMVLAIAGTSLFSSEGIGAFGKPSNSADPGVRSSAWGTSFVEALHSDRSSPVREVSVTDQGITLTVSDVVYDGNMLRFRYTLRSAEDFDASGVKTSLWIDGLTIGSTDEASNSYSTYRFEKRKIKAGEYEGAVAHALTDYRPSTFDLTFMVKHIGEKDGEWRIDSRVEKTNDIVNVDTDIQKKSEIGSISLDRISLSPVSTQLRYRFNLEKKYLGEHVGFGVELSDDQGNIYGTDSGYYSLTSNTVSGDVWPSYFAVMEGAKQLVLKPFFRNYLTSDVANKQFRTTLTSQPTEDDPLILPQGEAGNLLITSIEYMKDKTVIHFDPEGANPFEQSTFGIEDEKGNIIRAEWSEESIINHTVSIGPISRDEKLMFLTRPIAKLEYLPELEMSVDLPQS
ncbi:DUF4179 domain-containing protein [Cohnella endophytica]|uniref:DUF4179 domain-containing protein n=1 Tax=Cohnella endophytica TaxID=2419778 RepID=A0A494XUC0_9BACL|nr:DUF4179 domain-containing protein [Cohnella endophytica]RKP54170.1 DUF4179 domain-containing protein [Cohnella endophytica]